MLIMVVNCFGPIFSGEWAAGLWPATQVDAICLECGANRSLKISERNLLVHVPLHNARALAKLYLGTFFLPTAPVHLDGLWDGQNPLGRFQG